MSFHAVASLIMSISSLMLAAFVFLKGRNRSPNVTLALLSFAVAAWSFGQFMEEIVPGYEQALFWARFYLGSAIFIPVFFVNFVMAFLDKVNKRVLAISYSAAAVMFVLCFTPSFVPSVSSHLGFRFFPDPGRLLSIYTLLFFLMVFYGSVQLVYGYRDAKGRFKIQVMYVTIATVIGFLGGGMMFLAVFDIQIYPIGYYFVPVYIIIAIYSIMKHRFLDISFIIRRGLVYSILTLSITALYVLIIMFLQRGLLVMTGVSSVLAISVMVLLLAAFLNPIKDRIQQYVDMVFFKSRYDLQKELKNLSSIIRDTIKMDELTEVVTNELKDILKVEFVSIYILDQKTSKFDLIKGEGALLLNADHPLIAYLNATKRALLCEEMPQLADMRCGICLPMLVKGRIVGILLLGNKLSEDVFADEDIDLLSTISNQLAVSVENYMLYGDMLETQKQLYHADKLSTLGTLSASLAHEIKNPLASMKGFVHIIGTAIQENDQEAISDFLKVMPKQLDRINEMVEKLLRLARPTKPEFKNIMLNPVIEDVLKLVERQCVAKRVKVVKDLSRDIELQGDANQLTQAFMNLILNSIQAMPSGGTLTVKSRNDTEKSIEISDTGTGISLERLPHIFDPFYTTKDGGTGLGLAVTKKIIGDHQGKLYVESVPNLGTSIKAEFTV